MLALVPLAAALYILQTQGGQEMGFFQRINDFLQNIFGGVSSVVSTGIEARAKSLAKQKLIISEGDKLIVYRDTQGHLTVGIGHLVLPEDNLGFGDRITPERRDEFFKRDVDKAFNAALSQARELGRYTPEFIAALTEVNFQLGTGWYIEFSNTYAYLRTGNWRQAINNLLASKWNRQTPTRVANFINAIEQAYT